MKRKLLESFTGILQNLARRLVVRADLVRVARACLREKTFDLPFLINGISRGTPLSDVGSSLRDEG